ncbi:hypothetical protein AQUCO_01400749v1 [Aquilegia coerulea]|uniref:Kinesin motor domain-containing protein n=1 Tax=Aquilegia coerulea TaxID=218851 RepID=A0A2G5DXX6_AQUCA|nr:hypothetical protein AQUCO_01400749v1 [Aquilegia coerulea]
MEDSSSSSRTVLHDVHLASRKAEESALRRYQATTWLESFNERSLGLSAQPSEQEFVSCLRNGIVLCNVINKIQPGIVPKVIESHNNSSSSPLISEAQPLPAYQYFENVRNFLVAVEELKLPAFEASDLERESLDAGSTAKIVDCILSLKSYHEWKQWSAGANGSSKHLRSPMITRSTGRNQSRSAPTNSLGPSRNLDMSTVNGKTSLTEENENGKLEDSVVGAFVDRLLDTKENIDHNLLASLHNGNKLLSSLKTSNCNHWKMLEVQEKKLLFLVYHYIIYDIWVFFLQDLKMLLSMTKNEYEHLQAHLQNDLQALGEKVQEMSFAALGYQRVIKENKDLYNIVQDLKGNIRVYCRIRPIIGTDTRNVIDHIGGDGSLVVVDPLKPHKDARKVFQFNHVFGPTSSQDEVYKETQPLIRSVMDGYNVCIFAYGQTGSGKTHTMCGPSGGSSEDMGINYLALNDLFEISCTRKDIVKYEIQVQMVEIYNEQVRDLLTEDSSTTKLEIRNCTSNGGLSLPDATMHVVKSSMDVLDLMKLGETNRFVSATALNHQSSRSHSVLTVHVHGKDASGNILRSCLHLVDLAGSERVDKSEVTGDRLKEAQYINKSLSCLGDVITALAQKNSHIPYRNSKLTQLLQDSLGGHAKTLMFAHVSPEAHSYGETVSTLKFAQRVSTVELGAAHSNKESREVKELKDQVETLKKALSCKANEVKSPREKVKPMSDRTPPRPRRLSIENSIVKIDKSVNPDNKKVMKTPFVEDKLRSDGISGRPRRLSLEVPKYEKDQFQNRGSENVPANGVYRSDNHQCASPYSSQDLCKDSNIGYDSFQNAEASISRRTNIDASSITMVYRHTAPRSPTSGCQGKSVGTDSRMRRPTQLPRTPEPPSLKNRAYQTVTPSEFGLLNKSQAPAVAMSTTKKGSQIRRSLHTIGKLINPSDKKIHQHPVVTLSTTNLNDKSPLTANTRTLRRQSLTGGQTSGLSRRTSLGGKSTDSCSNVKRNAKTPPPVHPSSKATKQWF